MKQQEFMYSGVGERLKKEWKIYIAALIFIVIADSIGQIKVPLGPGTLILFPIFYSIFLGILSGPQVLKIFKKLEVKAASKLVIVCICPFIAKLGINAGASIETVISAGPGTASSGVRKPGNNIFISSDCTSFWTEKRSSWCMPFH